MAIRLFSDLHSEFSEFDMPELPTDKDDILVLAGDIGVAERPATFDSVVRWAPRFKKVIQILGNHEHYHGSMLRSRDKIIERYASVGLMDNVVVAHNEVVRVDNISFVCATLWTDFRRRNPIVMHSVQNALNDYRLIRTGPSQADAYVRRINAHDILKEFDKAKAFLFEAIVNEKYIDGQKVVGLTHHAPCELSIHPKYGNDIINWAYVSDLSNEILDTQPHLWLHGHTHSSFHYKVGETDVITNPRGYAYPKGPPENLEFDPTLRIEV